MGQVAVRWVLYRKPGCGKADVVWFRFLTETYGCETCSPTLREERMLISPVANFPPVSPPKPCTHLSPSIIRATYPAYLILLDFIIRKILGEENMSRSFTLWMFLHYCVTSSLLGPNTLLNTLFSNTISLRSSLNVSDQVSHPYKTTGKILVVGATIYN
jgi:hypothetical protein